MSPDVSPVVEVRQYTLFPGTRETLIELFDREFVETQEMVGMRVLGQFRDLDEPDRFVWLRGFASMDERREGLAAFYGGPVWAAHRDAANATMIDSDDVLLLRPCGDFGIATRSRVGDDPAVASIEPQFAVAIAAFDEPVDEALRSTATAMCEQADAAGIATVGLLETEPAENTFPALPVRVGEHVVVWITRFGSNQAAVSAEPDMRAQLAALNPRSIAWRRLTPTGRSAIR